MKPTVNTYEIIKLVNVITTVKFINLYIQALDLFQPKTDLTVSEWAEQRRIVSRAESERTGKWDNSFMPFLREIQDSVTNFDVEEITVAASAQIGKTEAVKNIIGYHIDHDPQKMLILEPTENAGRAFSLDKLSPMISNNDSMREKLYDFSKTNTILHKIFPGGSLTIVGSNSPNSLAQRSVKIVISDDIDRVPESAGEEGDPVKLAEQRTESFSLIGFKHIRFSTPTIRGLSRIEKLYELSDQRKYYVPCPYCDHKQVLKFDNLIWEKELDLTGEPTIHHPETTKYKCENENCGQLISEKHKNYMIQNGEWIAKYPERTHHRGYWINKLYTPLSSWKKIVKEYLECKDNPNDFQVFYNTTLGLSWEMDATINIDETGLAERVDQYPSKDETKLPKEILLLTSAVDVQPDRLELKIKGWGLNNQDKLQSYLVYYDQIWGSPAQEDVWNQLDIELNKEYITLNGNRLSIKGCFIDSAGHNTQDVYKFTQYRWKKNIFAIKGQAGFGKPVLLNKSIVGKKYGMTATLINLGVDTLKEMVYNNLKIKDKNQNFYMHFNQYATSEYFKGITSEKAITKNGKIVWIKKASHLRNEPLDLEVYNLALFYFITKGSAKYMLTLKKKYSESILTLNDIEQIEKAPAIENKIVKKSYTIKRKSNFINSWKGYN